MTTITGTIKDSGNQVLTGKLQVTLDAPFVDTSTSPDSVLTMQARTFTITSGVVNIAIPESSTENLTYRFVFFTETTTDLFFFEDGSSYRGPTHLHTDGQYYTGGTHTVNSVLLFKSTVTENSTVMDFHAIVPNVSSVEFGSLLPTGITTDLLDTSIRRLAELLTITQDYIEALRGGPRWQGVYSSATFYQRDDAVSYGGSSWVYINELPAANQTPSDLNTAYWLKLAQKGDAGGTGGQDTAYDPIGWNGATWAPTANVIRDVIETLAPLTSPALTGNPTAPTQLTTNDTARIATTAFCQALILDKFINAALTGNPTAPTQQPTDDSTRIASTAWVKDVYHRYSRCIESLASGTNGGSSINGIQTRALNTIDTNAGDIVSLASSTITLRAGTYRVVARAAGYKVTGHRVFLWNNTDSTRIINGGSNYTEVADAVNVWAALSGVFTLAAQKDIQLRHRCNNAQASNGLGVPVSEASINEIYSEIELWRID